MVDAMTVAWASAPLYVWLVLLGNQDVSRLERNEAAEHVLAGVRAWARPYLKRAAPCSLDDDDVDEIVQHLLTRCSVGTSRFRGSSEGEARVWCMRVLANKARDLCRARRRMKSHGPESEGQDTLAAEPELDALVARDVAQVLDAIIDELPRLHRAQNVSGLTRSLRCHIEARLGATLEEQLEAYGSPDSAAVSAASVRRARNRVYQYRARGRTAGCEALKSLVAQGRLQSEDVEDVRRLLGCELGSNDPTEKVLLS